MTKLALTENLYNSVVAIASASPSAEVCGFIAGRNGTCTTDYPVKNVAPTPECAYFMDPQGQINAISTIEQRGETLMAIYHSHPNTPAQPSERDLEGATYTNIDYLIISLIDKLDPKVAAFRIAGSEFVAVSLDIADA